MRQVRWITLADIVVLFVGLSGARAGSEFDQKAARCFAVKCSSVTYSKTVPVDDPDAASKQRQPSERLLVLGKIEIRDPNLVLGTHAFGVVTQVTCADGRDVEIPPERAFPQRLYDLPRYQDRYVQPPAEPQFRQLVRSALRLSPGGRFQPHWAPELQPSQMNLNIDLHLLEQAGGELPHVKGYFYALVAESIEHVDVPFEPNDTWVRLTPDQAVRLRTATRTPTGGQFDIDVRPQDNPWHPLSFSDPLPDRLVARPQFVGENGKVTPSPYAGGWAPIHLDGGGLARVPEGRIQALRFVIAVHPTHCRIPFELQHIPLPNTNQPPAQPQSGH